MSNLLNLAQTSPSAEVYYPDDFFFPKFRSVVNIDDPWHHRGSAYRELFPLGTLFLELTAYQELPPEWIKTLVVKITIGQKKIVLTDVDKITSRRWGHDGLYHIGVETSPILALDYPPEARFHLCTHHGHEWSAPLHKRLNRV